MVDFLVPFSEFGPILAIYKGKMNTNTTTEREIKMRKIEIGSKVQIGEEIWVVCEIDETEIRLGLNGQIKVFKR